MRLANYAHGFIHQGIAWIMAISPKRYNSPPRLAGLIGKYRHAGPNAPRFRFGFSLPGNTPSGYRETLPFRKHWPAIIFLLALASVMTIPLFSLSLDFAHMDDLFDLTTNLFSLLWGVGWSVGILIPVGLALLLLLARELILVEPESVWVRIEVLGFGAQIEYQRRYISHLRYITDKTIEGADWRKRHLTFDYLGVPVSVGFDLDKERAANLCQRINATLSSPIPDLPAYPPEVLKVDIGEPTQLQPPLSDAPPARSAAGQGNGSGKLSLALLVASNLVPLAGALLFGWRIGDLMLLFWLESAIIGLFNILKIFRIAGVSAIFYVLFFIGHFGIFMSVHLMLLFSLFLENGDNSGTMTLAETAIIFYMLWPAILALFISHGFSFYENFLGRKEYLFLTVQDQMQKPYSRIVLLHVTLLIGGFLVMATTSTLVPLIMLMTMKIIVDIRAHRHEHQTAGISE